MKKQIILLLLVLVLLIAAVAVIGQAEETLPAGGAWMVAADGTQTVAEDPAAAWATGNYAYVKLYGATDAFSNLQNDLWVDLNGFDLTVDGTGKVYAFDSANDTYDADACGKLTGTAQPQPEVTDPITGNRYIALPEGGTTSCHRLSVQMWAVSLRTNAAGLYYKAIYNCDETLEGKVQKYGVVLSLKNMPGADFASAEEEADVNRYTVATEPFQSGVIATSGSVFGIMKEDREAALNDQYGKMKIYANAYVTFDLGTELTVMGDADNGDKTAEETEFDGIAYSLRDVLSAIDGRFYTYAVETRARVDAFKQKWQEAGMKDWTFTQIDQEVIDGNAPLVLTDNVGYCPVCKRDMTWKPLYSQDTSLPLQDGDHYYLAEEVVSMTVAASTANGSIIVPGKDKSACLHLNGNKIYAPGNAVIFGNSGKLNVMGDGIVHGNRNIAGWGDAIQVNNAGGCIINLYGGTYMKSGTNRGAVLTVANAGGTINIYKDVKVQAASNITSLRIGNGGSKMSKFGVYGADLTGAKVLFDDEIVNEEKQAVLELVDAKIGNVDMVAGDTVLIKGETVAKKITLPEDAKLTVDQMAPGSSVGVAGEGIISHGSQYAQANQGYFVPGNTYQRVSARGDQLYCGKDFVTDGPIQEGYCPACEQSVTWEPMPADHAGAVEGHYYLTKDVTHTAASSYISCPGSGKVGCVHLNGHNITATAYQAIYSGSGVLNVMGTGTVTGYSSSSINGSAVQANNGASGTAINLYAGTYRGSETENTYVIATRGAGGRIQVYQDVQVIAGTSGKAIRVADTGDADKGRVYLYGASVTGKIQMEGSTYAAESSVLTLDDAKVDGTVEINGLNTVTISGRPQLKLLKIASGSLVTVDDLKSGAEITVDAEGVFATPNENAAAYAQYFTAAESIAYVDAVDNALTYRYNYSGDLPETLVDGGKALCPVCKVEVQWTAITQAEDTTTRYTLEDGKHYFLASSLEYTGEDGGGAISSPTSSGTTACLHLNGNNITSANKYAIFGSGGVLNIMGTGTVAGKGSSPGGAAIQINNTVQTNAVNLYGGTYTRVAGCGTGNPVLSARYRGTFDIHEGVVVDGGSGEAIYLGTAKSRRSELIMNSCTVKGNIKLSTPESTYPVTMSAVNTTITGTVTANAGTAVTLSGKLSVGKMVVAEGVTVDITNLTVDSVIPVSANGVFTNTIEKLQADRLLSCFSTADEGDWVVSRDGAIVQEVKPTQLPATEQDAAALEALFTGKTPYYGELHNHAKTGGRSDGNYTLEEWVAHMEAKRIDFATIVDHKQSIHMYLDAWDDACFIGGSEPAVPELKETKATQKSLHYNMVFADAAKFEEHLKNIPAFNFTPAEDGNGGFYSYVNFSVSEMKTMVQSVLDHGGFFVHVHPLFDNYLVSEDPLDYWFGDKTGFEIATTSGGVNTMAQKDCVEAYQFWNEMLRLNKRVFATIGDDNHRLSDLSSMTTIYATEKTPQTFVDHAREGDMTAGPVGIRMSLGETITGGIASFAGGRLVLAVGDIHEGFYSEEKRAGHTYGVELYDDGGILFATEIDPTQMNYFAIDTDASQMYYRAVVVDLTTGERIAVGNPIFNSAFYSEAKEGE